MPNENDKVQHRTSLTVPLLQTTSDVVRLSDQRILSLEQAPDVQGDRVHLEVSGDGEHFMPFASIVRPPQRLVLLDVGPVDGYIRVRLDAPQNNERQFWLITR